MKKIFATALFFFSCQAWGTGFTQPTFTDSPTFSYPNSYTGTVNVSFQISDSNPNIKFFVKDDVVSAVEDPTQLVSLFADSGLTTPLASQGINLDGLKDGQPHTVQIYAKYYSTLGNAISRAGSYNFNVPLYINGDTVEYTANLNLTPTVQGSCGFTQPSYSVSTNISPNSEAKNSVNTIYNCSPGLTPIMTSDSSSYASAENSNITLKLFSDSAYSLKLNSNPINLTADGANKSQRIYLQYFQNNGHIITVTNRYNFTSTIVINF